MQVSSTSLLVVSVLLSSCKPRNGATLAGASEPTFATAAEAVTYVSNKCASSALFRGTTDRPDIRFHSVQPDKTPEETRDYYMGSASYQDTTWQLDVAFGSSASVPSCLVDKRQLSTQEFLEALGCIENTSCPPDLSPVSITKLIQSTDENLRAIGEPSQTAGVALNLASPNLDLFPFKKFDCEDSQRFYHGTVLEGGKLKCQPDTLYSWGPAEKTSDLKAAGWGIPFWTRMVEGKMRHTPIFATTDPVGSFGYGPYAIRIKLKKGVRFKHDLNNSLSAYQYCDEDHMSAEAAQNTVVVRYLSIPGGWPDKFNKQHPGHTGSALDFIICGPGPIHSWSYGTKQHLEEILRNQKVYAELKNSMGNEWYKYMEYYGKQDGIDIFDTYNIDGKNFSFAFYEQNIARHRQSIVSGASGVFYSPGTAKSGHFETDFRFYYHQKSGGADAGENGSAPIGDDSMKQSDFEGLRFRDNAKRTIWLDVGGDCTVKSPGSNKKACSWTFNAASKQITAKISAAVTWYYRARSVNSICFIGENSPGASCIGSMEAYTP